MTLPYLTGKEVLRLMCVSKELLELILGEGKWGYRDQANLKRFFKKHNFICSPREANYIATPTFYDMIPRHWTRPEMHFTLHAFNLTVTVEKAIQILIGKHLDAKQRPDEYALFLEKNIWTDHYRSKADFGKFTSSIALWRFHCEMRRWWSYMGFWWLSFPKIAKLPPKLVRR
jgi:hypothetical protein